MRSQANRTFALSFITAFCVIASSYGLSMGKNGGYNVILGIKSDEPKPADVATYRENIISTFKSLSGKMWGATNGNFHLASLDIVLPQSWNVTMSDDTTLSYVTADIRISSKHTSPYVENQNLCGQPGDFIELPASIFDGPNSKDWGENWKVLLVSWARYRWGAYEEHGFPGDKRFPYFTKDFEAMTDKPKWLPNGCTNAEGNKLLGDYRELDNTPCDPTRDEELDFECRFFPDQEANINVTSSLMTFHFMDSVTRFCDNSTHQKHVPTKQNLYCEYKSVMETIESSPDYKAVESKAEELPELKITFLTSASKPAVYLLLDNGIADSKDEELMSKVSLELMRYFLDEEDGLSADTVIAVGELPLEEGAVFLQELVPFGFLEKNRGDIIDVITRSKQLHQERPDFGIALQQAAAAIRAKSPSEGGNILYVKTTAAKNTSIFSSEKELELVLRRENIRLYTLEIVDENRKRENLAGIATATKGSSISISANQLSDAKTIIQEWLASLESEEIEETGRVERINYSQEVSPNQNYTIQIWASIQNLTFIFSTPEKLKDISDLAAGVFIPVLTFPAEFAESRDYGENRYVYTGSLDLNTNDTIDWTLNEVSFSYLGNQNGHLLVLSDGENLADDITVEVWTSVGENVFDLGNIQKTDAPFVITVSVHQNNVPVAGANVTATFLLGYELVQQIPLLDYTPGLDNPAGDGFYSEIILFPRDGEYTVTVTVTKATGSASNFESLASTRLIPPDQKFGMIDPVPYPAGATSNRILGHNIRVKNTDQFVPSIQKIRDFFASQNMDNTSLVTFTFSAPRVLDLVASMSPSCYRVYSARNPDLLIDLDVENLPEGVEEAFEIEGGARPGTTVSASYFSDLDLPLYFAAVGFYDEMRSLASNIVRFAPTLGVSTTIETTYATESTTEEDTTDTPTDNESTTENLSSTDISETSPTSEGSTEAAEMSTVVTSTVDPEDGATSTAETTTALTEGPEKNSSTQPSTESPKEESKPWVKTGAGIATIIILVLICLGAVAGGYVYFTRWGHRRSLFGSSEA